MMVTYFRFLLPILVLMSSATRLAVGFMIPTHTNRIYSAVNFNADQSIRTRRNDSPSSGRLYMSLKPMAGPLMDSGKALARSGELLIDVTSEIDLYGGALSAAGALIRNSGDNIAQAAASCRFKTGNELVYDELRQAAASLAESSEKLQLAVEEAESDKDQTLANCLAPTVSTMEYCGESLEAAGAGIMLKSSLKDIASNLIQCGERLLVLSNQLQEIAPSVEVCKTCAQRMAFASDRMIEAANKLQGTEQPKPKGKGWLKG